MILSARGGEADKVAALDIGADDYVTKPFGSEELLARIRVALRRLEDSEGPEVERIAVADLIIDYNRRRVLRGDEEIRLTPKEFELLALLAHNADRVLTHRTILKTIWGANAVEQPEHLWVLMAQLRKKIEPDPGNPRYLLSEPFVGYRLVSAPAARLSHFLGRFRPAFRARVPMLGSWDVARAVSQAFVLGAVITLLTADAKPLFAQTA